MKPTNATRILSTLFAVVVQLFSTSALADSTTTDDHLYTVSSSERQKAIASLGFRDEGTCCYLPVEAPKAVPLYRLVHRASGDRFYTTSLTERDEAIARSGYTAELDCCYVYPQPFADAIPLYRLYNPQAKSHLYTTSAQERSSAIAKFGFADEGVCCYLPSGTTSQTAPLFRLVKPGSGQRLYTTSAVERDAAVAAYGFQLESTCCHVLGRTPSAMPLYRLYNERLHDHLYTTSIPERDRAIATAGYVSEGVCCYAVLPGSGNAVPLYRTFHPATGNHLYTASTSERDRVVAQLDFVDEGVCCYVYKDPIPGSTPLYRLHVLTQAGALAFRAVGDLQCRDNGGLPMPLSFARVEIYRFGSTTNDLMAIGGTDRAGHFEIEVRSDDPWVLSNVDNLDLRAVGVLDDDYPSTPQTRPKNIGHPVRHINENHSSISFKVPASGAVHARNGVAKFGSWIDGTDRNTSGSDNSSHCAVWLYSRDAYVAYINEVGALPPVKQYDVISIGLVGTPWTILETTDWPHYYQTGGGSVNTHEFGHAVRHSFDGDWNHWFNDAGRFRYARYHELCDSKHLGTEGLNIRQAYAFNEGWAEYWAGTTAGCDGRPSVVSGDMTVEGEVARALQRLADCQGRNSPGKAGMVRVLQRNPGAIHSFAEFAQRFRAEFPGCRG
jgi:hypothetical protein